MPYNQIYSQHDSVNSQITSQDQKPILHQPKCCCKLFIWNSHRAKRSQRHDHHHDRTHKICLYRCLSDHQSANNANSISQRSRNSHPSLPNQFKSQFQKNQFHHTGKGHSFPRLRKRQYQCRWQNLCMETYHCQVKSRQNSRHDHSQISQYSEKGSHLEPVIPVLAALHETAKISRKDQCFRRIITQNHNLTFQDFLHSTIRTFRCLILRKRRIPHIFCQLFKHTAVKDSVNLKFFQPFLHFLQKSLMYQVIHV